MSQGDKSKGEEMRKEYDIRGGIRGKYFKRFQQGTSIVLLEPTDTLTRDRIQMILDSGKFNDLIGVFENEWLECKAAPYRVKDEHQKQELAKDVSALANASGGILLIGLKTQRDLTHFGDRIQEVRAFPQTLVDASQYYDLLKNWIYPTPQQIEIRWYPSYADQKKGILAIVIPTQESFYKPFLLRRTLDAKEKRIEIVFGYCERRRANVDAMSVEQLHALIRDGSRFESLDQKLENIQNVVVQLKSQLTQAPSAAAQDLLRLLEERVAQAVIDADLGGRRSFSLAVIPTHMVEIPNLFERRDADTVRLLEYPPELRQGGFDLQTGSPARIVRGQLRRSFTPKYKILDLWRDGTLIFAGTADEDFLCWGKHSASGAVLRINPLALIESTYLFAELSKQVFEQTKPQPTTLEYRIELQNMNLENKPCVLVPGPVGTFAWEFGNDMRKPPERSLISTLRWDAPSIKPGQVAFQLVREVYRWFGIEDSNIPYKEEVDGLLEISPQQIRKAGP